MIFDNFTDFTIFANFDIFTNFATFLDIVDFEKLPILSDLLSELTFHDGS
jgi:hypothetical protein